MAGLRTWGDLGDLPFGGLLNPSPWQLVIALLSDVSILCLTLAMAAVGLGTHLARLRVLGLRPLAAGLLAAVGCVSVLVLLWLGPRLSARV